MVDNLEGPPAVTRARQALLLLAPIFLALPAISHAWADDAETLAAAVQEEDSLERGVQVYTESCSACHQPGGAGVAGQFPPLIDNPRVLDTPYMQTVIENGLEGEIEVNGIVYDGRMPAFSTLSEQDVSAVITYIQSGFAAPVTATAVPDPGGSSGLDFQTVLIGFAIALGVVLVLFSPRVIAAGDRLTMPWFDAWLKSAVIVIWFVLFIVLVPSWVLQTDRVARMSNTAQDLIGLGLWAAGLGLGLRGLWLAQRGNRI